MQISERDAKELARSLDKYEHVLPYVAAAPKNGAKGLPLLDGHQRKMVELSLRKVSPNTLVDVRVPSRKLSDKEKQELVIRLRKNTGEFDFDKLANYFDVPDLLDWGFSEKELQLGGFEFGDDSKDAEPQVDRAAELLKKWKVKSGDLWQIGDHRLICGDCTDAAVVARVMGGERALLCVTDQPYGVEYDANWRNEAAETGALSYAASRIGKVESDDRSDWTEAWRLFTGDVIYLWHDALEIDEAKSNLLAAGFEVRSQIIWVKSNFPISRGHYTWKHESCWYAVRKGSTASWCGDGTQNTVWEATLDKNAEGGHSTQKPVELMEHAVRNHNTETVYEPFSGSGTTLVACENLGRKCRAVEISPAYVAVALQRMQDAFPDLRIERVK